MIGIAVHLEQQRRKQVGYMREAFKTMTTDKIMAILMIRYRHDTVFEGQMGLNELPVLVSACFLCHHFETAINGEGLVIQHQPWSRRAPHGSIMSIIKSTKHYIIGYREWPTNFKTFHTTLIQNPKDLFFSQR